MTNLLAVYVYKGQSGRLHRGSAFSMSGQLGLGCAGMIWMTKLDLIMMIAADPSQLSQTTTVIRVATTLMSMMMRVRSSTTIRAQRLGLVPLVPVPMVALDQRQIRSHDRTTCLGSA